MSPYQPPRSDRTAVLSDPCVENECDHLKNLLLQELFELRVEKANLIPRRFVWERCVDVGLIRLPNPTGATTKAYSTRFPLPGAAGWHAMVVRLLSQVASPYPLGRQTSST